MKTLKHNRTTYARIHMHSVRVLYKRGEEQMGAGTDKSFEL
jgi:hypothetical protein